MKLDFEHICKELLNHKTKSEYKQAAIVMLRDVFTKAQNEQCNIAIVSYCYECNKPYYDKDREHGMCHKCWQPIIEE